ncbi:hypothetical protein EDD22DRAFT_947856 [Suillus occidentalis]|nr:hypothetical protein EDD22DRAFT_947856 [Suillus occidentalis]
MAYTTSPPAFPPPVIGMALQNPTSPSAFPPPIIGEASQQPTRQWFPPSFYNHNRRKPGLPAVTDTLQNIQLDVDTQSKKSQEGSPSAISRLPTEILTKIFLYCVPESENVAPEPHLAPMLLTRVCRRWREIAVDMPDLWCRLRLEDAWDDWQQRAFCYDLCLKRSQGRQLSLTLECYNGYWVELQSLLQPYIDQISILSLGYLWPGCMFFAGDSLKVTDFHALKELSIDMAVFNGRRGVMPTATRLPSNLRSIKVKRMWFCPRTLLQCFDHSTWVHVTNLEIAIDSLNSFRLLRRFPNLSSLTVSGRFTILENLEAFTHANLRSLRISGLLIMHQEENPGLFKDVTLPNLHSLEVRNIGRWLHEEFKEFLTRSECPLESLIFGSGVEMTNQQHELAEYVTLVPSLTSVVVDPMRSEIYFD